MPIRLGDFLAGTVESTLIVHLATSALPLPFTLGTLPEATFAGYAPAMLNVQTHNDLGNGWTFTAGLAAFTNGNLSAIILLRGLWLTANYQGTDYLVAVVTYDEGEEPRLPPGVQLLQVGFSCFNHAEG